MRALDDDRVSSDYFDKTTSGAGVDAPLEVLYDLGNDLIRQTLSASKTYRHLSRQFAQTTQVRANPKITIPILIKSRNVVVTQTLRSCVKPLALFVLDQSTAPCANPQRPIGVRKQQVRGLTDLDNDEKSFPFRQC